LPQLNKSKKLETITITIIINNNNNNNADDGNNKNKNNILVNGPKRIEKNTGTKWICNNITNYYTVGRTGVMFKLAILLAKPAK